MVMDIGLFGTLRKLKIASSTLRIDDDFIDRLNHYYTAIVIVVFTFIISAKQYVGQPLQCWVPAQFTTAMEQYAENYCWIQNTYYLPLRHTIPKEHSHRNDRKIGYYQWVPFMLVCQALLFYLPNIVWRLLNWESGINFRAINRMTSDAQNVNPDSRGKTIRAIARHIEDALRYQKRERRDCLGQLRQAANKFLLCSRRHGVFLSLMYFLVKLLYICNCVCQFFLLNAFLGSPYQFFGWELLINMISGVTWEESGQFPRVTMCDFEIRVLGNLHRHTVQCVLVINLFNEKIFVFLWFWLFLVAVATVMSFFTWLYKHALPPMRHQFVLSSLRMADSNVRRDSRDVAVRHQLENFVSQNLRCDGVFVLRMLAINAGEIISAEVAREMWLSYRGDCKRPLQTGNANGPDQHMMGAGDDQSVV
uniref:Innexin n=1 Tax=Macrostomum lignano TaxID=282301 RepID=A0A1I8IYE0_9PLAT